LRKWLGAEMILILASVPISGAGSTRRRLALASRSAALLGGEWRSATWSVPEFLWRSRQGSENRHRLFQIRAKDGSDPDRKKKHARSVPKNMGRSGRRFLGGSGLFCREPKTIDYWRRESSIRRESWPSSKPLPFTFCYWPES